MAAPQLEGIPATRFHCEDTLIEVHILLTPRHWSLSSTTVTEVHLLAEPVALHIFELGGRLG